MAFTTWSNAYSSWKDVLAGKIDEKLFWSSYENSREMRITYTKLGNIMEFTEWLAGKAALESAGISEGGIPFSIGGC